MVIVVKSEFEVLATTFAYNKPNIKVALISSNLGETLSKENTSKCDLVVSDPKEVLGYVRDLVRQKENLARSVHLSPKSSAHNFKPKLSRQEREWEERVFRAMGESNYNEL